MIKYFSILFILSMTFAINDPTRPYNYKMPDDKDVNDINLHMTYISDSNRIAIIDGNMYKVGDFIAGRKIDKISTGEIALKDVTTDKIILIKAK